MAAATRESGYGYSATKLAGDRYELSYITPPLSLATDPKSRAVQIEAQEQQAYDLALWRAAEMALAAGFDRLVVSDRKAQLQPITPYQPPAPGVYGPGGMIYPQWIYNPGVSYYGAPGIGPYWMYDDPFAEAGQGQAQLSAQMQVTFVHGAAAGSLDAAATVRRLAAQYANARY
jgi:hypothetical protein